MTLKELKALLDAANAALEADPENSELKTKAEEAQAAYDAKVAEEGEGENEEDPDESALDAKTKSYLAKLRKENAKYRIDAKESKSKLKAEEEKKKAILRAAGIELEDDEEPTEKLKKVSETNNNLQFRNAILETAVAHGVGSDGLKYFQFLMSEAVNELEEDEELSDEKLAEIVAEAKAKGGKGKANTSVGTGGKGGKEAPKPGASDKVTLEKFTRMTMVEKSKLYETNRALYEELVNEAKKKRVLV